ICEILDNKRVPITASNRESGPYPYYGANGIQDYVAGYIFDDELVLLAEDGGYFGSNERPIAYRVSGKCWVNNHAHVLKPLDGIDVDYLCYSLMYKDVSNIVNGATRQKLTQTDLREIRIPILSIGEQKKIVLGFNKCFSLIQLRKQQLEKLDQLVKSRFIEMFGDPILNQMGWDGVRLKKLSSKILSGNTPKGGNQVYVDEGIMFFRSQNVWKNRIELGEIAYIDHETHNRMSKSSLKFQDILMTKTGRINTENSSLGRAAMYLGEDDRANINGHVYLIRLKENIVKEFVLFILTTIEYREYIRSVCVGGIDKRQLNKEHIEEFPIIMPPKEMQIEFASFVKQVDKLRHIVQKNLEKLETLKKALMQKYFK
ncbi:MAG: restriction endonuclease subunit S, partial [Saccharofermentanales bacterium]